MERISELISLIQSGRRRYAVEDKVGDPHELSVFEILSSCMVHRPRLPDVIYRLIWACFPFFGLEQAVDAILGSPD